MTIDWKTFDRFPEDNCTCRCGTVFKSHAKMVSLNGRFSLLTRKPCPNCKRVDNSCSVKSDWQPERLTRPTHNG